MRSDQQDGMTDVLRTLARALAPYIDEELQRLRAREQQTLSSDYDANTCARFVSELGDSVLDRAQIMFALIDESAIVDSVTLAEKLGMTPRALSGALTTPLKRRAATLDLPLPFHGGLGGQPFGGIKSPDPALDPRRTHWQDRADIASRMLTAIAEERISRQLR